MHYAKELMEEVNADQEAHGKKPFDNDKVGLYAGSATGWIDDLPGLHPGSARLGSCGGLRCRGQYSVMMYHTKHEAVLSRTGGRFPEELPEVFRLRSPSEIDA